MSYHSLQTEGGRLHHYLDIGAGAPIVLLHCSSGSSSAWRPVIDSLGPDHRALAPDLLGYGRNAPWSRGAPLQQDSELTAIAALLEAAGEPVHLVGHSYGGAVALDAALRFPDRIASLTLIEPVAFRLLKDADEPDGWREIAAVAERHLDLVAQGRDAEAAEAFSTYWMGAAAWRQMPVAARDSVIRTAAKVAAEWELMFAAQDNPRAVAGIAVPTLLICGRRTRSPARHVMTVLRSILSHARYIEIADAGHMSPLSHPAAIADAVRAHIGTSSLRDDAAV